MSASVPLFPPSLADARITNAAIANRNGYQSGGLVIGGQWQRLADLENWITGRGGCLVAPNRGPGATTASGNTYRYNVWPRGEALHRMWVVRAWGGVASFKVVSAENPTIIAQQRSGATLDQSSTYTLIVPVATPGSTAEEEATITVSQTGSGTVSNYAVDSIALYELPRSILQVGASENAVDLASCKPGEYIADRDEASVGGVLTAVENCRARARRNSIWHWASGFAGVSSLGIQEATTSFVNSFLLPQPALARHMYSGGTTGTLAWRVYATAITTNGEIRLTTTSGATSTITITAGAGYAWWPLAGAATFTVNSEDISTSNGLRGAAYDDMTIAARVAVGGGTMRCQAISVGEPP